MLIILSTYYATYVLVLKILTYYAQYYAHIKDLCYCFIRVFHLYHKNFNVMTVLSKVLHTKCTNNNHSGCFIRVY